MPNHSSSFSSAHRNVSLHSSTQIADPQHIDSSSGPHSRVASSKSQSSAAKTDDFNSWSESSNTSASGDNGFTTAPGEPSQHRFWATVPPCTANPTPGSDSASIHTSLEEAPDGLSQLVVHNRIPTQAPGNDTAASEQMHADWNTMLVPAPHLLLHQPGSRSQVGIPGIMGRDHQSRILFVSLLESYCRTYDDDPLRNRRLFFAICRTLYSMGIIGKEYVDEMSSIRATYSDAFRQLVAKAQASLDMYKQHDIETGIRSLMAGVADESSESLGPDQLESSGGGWSASDQGAEPDQTDDVFERVRMQRRESAGVADRCVAGHQAAAATGVPIMPLRAKSRRNTVSNFGNPSTSHAPRSLSYKHSYPRTYRQHSAHQGGSLQAYGSNANVNANNSAPTTFESMIIDMQRSRYHDDFIQLQCLGKGGFGKVYEVRNKLDARRYAVKQIKIKGEITAEKTLREIKTLAHLDHPNIVRYYSSWIEVTKLRKRTSYNSKDSGNGILGIVASPPPLPQSSAMSQQSQHQGFRHRHAAAAAADHMTDDNSSFALSSDDEVSFCLAEQQQQDGCFEMSLTGDGEGQKAQPVEDSALESLDETSGYSLWRTANYQDIAIDDENAGFDVRERDAGRQDDSNNSSSSSSSGSSCQISFVDFGGNDTDNDVVFVAGGDFSDSHDDDDDDGDDDDEVARSDGNKEAGDMKLEDKNGSVSCPSTAVCGANSCPGEQNNNNNDDEQKVATTNGSRGHVRRKSVHVVGGTYIDDEYGAKNYIRKISRSPQGLYDDGSFASAGQQARSLPSQGMAIPGMSDGGQTLVAETSLFVQMQLCQTTLQEFLMQRNERIASRQASANSSASLEKHPADGDYRTATSISDPAADWCAKREHDLLIDPVMNIRLFRAIVEGVKYFHNRGVIHRDLKGANVFLDIVYSDSGGNPISRGGSGIGRPDVSTAQAYQQSQQPGLSSVHPLSRVMHAGGGGLVSVHSDVWDAVDGGNLKEKIGVVATSEYDERNSATSAPVSMVPGDPLLDNTDGAGAGDVAAIGAMETRKVDWDSIFESILAHRSIDGTAHGNGFGDKARCASDGSDSDAGDNEGDKGGARRGNPPSSVRKKPSTAYMSPVLPPAVSFIPRIGDFGLATKATLGIRTSGDEYAFIGNSRGVSTRQSSSGSSRNSSASSTPSGSNKNSQSKKQQQQQAAMAAGSTECCWDTRRTSNVGTITYAAPEQLSDKATDYSEKADIYSLGIIFFELYYPFATAMERIAVIRDLRRGVFPPQFLQMWPKEAALILQLMDADPTKRPSAKEILAFDLIDVPTLESAQLKREVIMLRQQLRVANQRNEELGLRVRELERIVDMSI
ncbi:hypothetical protein IWW48_001961 [Coemansia sp. RSA 1200]|nr:hypothetical protein IWW48_001961 [Coemansia sp. RSA 1200]